MALDSIGALAVSEMACRLASLPCRAWQAFRPAPVPVGSDSPKEVGTMKRLLIVLAGALAASIAAAACAGGGTEVVEKIVEVPVVEEVVKEVEVERVVEVEKEVVREVEVERVVEVEVEKLLIATPTPPPVTGEPQFGGTLRIVAQASINSLDPAHDGAYVAVAVGSHMFESPLGWDLRSG